MAVLVCKQISEITYKLCKQMTDVELRLLCRNTWNHLTVYKKTYKTQARLRIYTKCVYKSYIFNIYV